MKTHKRYALLGIMLLVVIGAVFVIGCTERTSQQEDYDKCTAVCAAVVEGSGDEALVTLEICRQECKKKFLN